MENNSLHTVISNAVLPHKKNTEEEKRKRQEKIIGYFISAEKCLQLPPGYILKKTRKREVAHIRFMVYFYLKDKGYTPTEVSKVLNINHSSVLHGIEAAKGFFDVYEESRQQYLQIKKSLDE